MKKQESSKAIVPFIQKELTPFAARVETLSIIDEKSMGEAATVRTALKDLLSKVEKYRKAKTDPINQALKVIRAETKPLETAIEEALETVNRKMTVYQTEADAKAEAEAAKIAARVGEGRGHLKPETAVAQIDDIARPATQVGSVKFNTIKKFEVMDVVILLNDNQDGQQYVYADETAIRAAMRAGIELKGVRYYTEKVPAKA